MMRVGLTALALSGLVLTSTSENAFAKGKKIDLKAREANVIECQLLKGQKVAAKIERQENGERWGYIDCQYPKGKWDVCRYYDNGERICAQRRRIPGAEPVEDRRPPINSGDRGPIHAP